MSSGQQQQKSAELDARARLGETVVPGGTGGKTLEAQEHLAEGRRRGGHTRKEQNQMGGTDHEDQEGQQQQQNSRAELDARARQGETVVPGGTGGKTLKAQEHLAEGRSKGGQTRKEQMGTEGYQEMGRKGGLGTMEETGGERAAREGIQIDESKYRTKKDDEQE